MLKIREATPSDAVAVREVVLEHVDEYSMDVETLLREETGVVAIDDGKVVGVSVVKERCSIRGLLDECVGRVLPRPDVIGTSGERFALLTTGYVRRERMREGIGRLLLSACMQHAKSEDIDAVYAVADVYDRERDARTLLESSGFEKLWESEDYWDISQCSMCSTTCRCRGAFYRICL